MDVNPEIARLIRHENRNSESPRDRVVSGRKLIVPHPLTYTPEQKLEILREAAQPGGKRTRKTHGRRTAYDQRDPQKNHQKGS
jgi:hypothetical protein